MNTDGETEIAAEPASGMELEATAEFEFREATEVGDVESLLRLRWRVYRDTEGLCKYAEADGPPILMDAYDRVSRLYGLFARGDGWSRAVGTIRLTGQSASPALMALEMIASSDRRLADRLHARRRSMFASLDDYPRRESAERLITRSMVRGARVVEAARLAIDPGARASRVGGPELTAYMITSALTALFLPEGCDEGFVTCVPRLARLYARFGFRQAEGTGVALVPRLGVEWECMHIQRDWLPAGVRGRVLALAEEMAATGRTTRTVAVSGHGALSSRRPSYPTLHLPRPLSVPSMRSWGYGFGNGVLLGR